MEKQALITHTKEAKQNRNVSVDLNV